MINKISKILNKIQLEVGVHLRPGWCLYLFKSDSYRIKTFSYPNTTAFTWKGSWLRAIYVGVPATE